MCEEFLGELFISGVFGLPSIPDDVVYFLFDVLELDPKTLVEFIVSFISVIGPDDFNEFLQILFNVLIIS